MKHFLNPHSRKLFFFAYIQSIIDYVSTIWDSSSENILKPLCSLHRRALKLIKCNSSTLNVTEYKKLDILPLRSKLYFNKAVVMYKIMSGNAPPSLIAKFTSNNARHSHKIMVPRPRIDLYKSSLAYSGGTL